MNRRQRRLAFVGVCVAAAVIPAVYVAVASRSRAASAGPSVETVSLERVDAQRPGLLFRSTIPGRTFGKVVFLPFDALGGAWHVSTLSCERLYFRRGRGMCLTLEDSLLPPYAAATFDDRFRPGGKTALTGPPSRTRVSPDGRRAAITVFESGHSYAEGSFSTRTTLVDTSSGSTIADLEDFTVSRDGAAFKAADFNFWGVTFAADGNRFYATLRTAGTDYLIEGDVDRRAARVMRAGVECPSLSPDEQRIAFKKRGTRPEVHWRLAVLDLATMRETVLDAEPRSVDDQVEWLDDRHLLYFQSGPEGNNIWSLQTDRPEPPSILVRGGTSPAVVR
jgi:hypothetical protein